MNWSGIVDDLGYPVAALGLLIESIGIPFPGEALLILAAIWAAGGDHSIAAVILFGCLGAIASADLSYWLGYRGGRPFVERFGAGLRFRPEQLAQAELLFAHHGDRAIVVGRFILGLRTWGSMLAGMAGMPFWRFQLFTALGALTWAVVIGAAGYAIGSNVPLLESTVRAAGAGGLAVILLIAAILLVAQAHAIRRR